MEKNKVSGRESNSQISSLMQQQFHGDLPILNFQTPKKQKRNVMLLYSPSLFFTLLLSTLLCSATLLCCTLLCSTLLYGLLYYTLLGSTLLCSTLPGSTLLYLYSTRLYFSLLYWILFFSDLYSILDSNSSLLYTHLYSTLPLLCATPVQADWI